MSATLDLVLLRGALDTDDKPQHLYRVKTIITEVCDTHGLITVHESAKALLFDSLLGDGPKRFGLQTLKKVRMVRNRPRQKTYRHYRLESCKEAMLISNYRHDNEEDGFSAQTKLTALTLLEFILHLENLAQTDRSFWNPKTTLVTYQYLKNLPDRNWLVMPLVGIGLTRYMPYELSLSRGFTSILQVGYWS